VPPRLAAPKGLFCTAINCIDGRIQLPVIEFLKVRFGTTYVDVLSEAGPAQLLAVRRDRRAAKLLLERLAFAIKAHDSMGIAIAAHHDCVATPADDDTQRYYVTRAVNFLAKRFNHLSVLGLWLDDGWSVHEVCSEER
jgi:hypothetical protein